MSKIHQKFTTLSCNEVSEGQCHVKMSLIAQKHKKVHSSKVNLKLRKTPKQASLLNGIFSSRPAWRRAQSLREKATPHICSYACRNFCRDKIKPRGHVRDFASTNITPRHSGHHFLGRRQNECSST